VGSSAEPARAGGGVALSPVAVDAINAWLTAYGEAWQTRDPAAAAELFTETATYEWGPFGDLLQGRAAIRERWAEVTAGQRDVAFGFEVLGIVERGGVAHWQCSFSVGEVRIELDGIFLVTLAADGRCRVFREWWNERVTPAA
jgi:ketosteroid isomerase-like protein